MKATRRLRRAALFALPGTIAVLALRCTLSMDPGLAGGNTSTVDNKVCGVIFTACGEPAVNAKVAMRSSGYLATATPLGKRRAGSTMFSCSTRTDPEGKYRFTVRDSIPAGTYSIEAQDGIGNCLFIQDIPIDSSFLKSNTWLGISSPEYDTKLKPPCVITGTVPSTGDSLSGTVYVYGLDTYAEIDPDGSFMLVNVPAGNLRLKVVTSENGVTRNDTVSVTARPTDTTTVSKLPATPAVEVGIDASRTYQTIDGFGASSAWIGHKITAGLADIFWKDDTLDGHIGLSLLRTRIDADGYSRTESSPVLRAIEVNPDLRIWSTSWTPPVEFKDNGSLFGGHFIADLPSMEGFAEHLVRYVQDFKTNTGVDLYAVSFQNEPDSAGEVSNGCFWTPNQISVFLRDFLGPAFDNAGITAKRMIGESVRNDLAITDPALLDSAAAGYADIIGTHLYLGGPNPYPLAESLNKPYWATEVSGLDGVDTGIANALMWADMIHDCLVRCNMSAFHYWWLVNYGTADDDEGLCNAEGNPTPRLYALGNFSKFIRPGFVRIATTGSLPAGVNVSAFYGSEYNRLVIVVVNSGDAKTIDFNLSGISGGATAVPWLTDTAHRLEREQPAALSDTAFSYTLPRESVVTFVAGDIVPDSN